MYTINLAKELFKFSCSHFTIFSPTHAERLHGHNYQVRVTIGLKETDPKLGFAFDFNLVKPMIRAFCDSLDERILIPKNSPYIKIDATETQVNIQFADKKYSFPKSDTLVLPLVNISTEELCRYACTQLSEEMKNLPSWSKLKVGIEETRGQSVTYQIQR